jgi:hypothetical protein
MEIEQQLFFLSFGVLVATSSIFGLKFFMKGNHLLGAEWLLITVAATSILVYALGSVDAAYDVAYFCDAFLRGCGGPAIMILGLMAVTHDFKPLPYVDLYLFGGAAAGTAALVEADAAARFSPVFYLCTWTMLSFYLAHFARRLLAMGVVRHAIGVGLVLVAAQAVAVVYDFVTLPGDEEHLYFYTLAASVWSLLCVEMYYAYCALERVIPERVRDDDRREAPGRLFRKQGIDADEA